MEFEVTGFLSDIRARVDDMLAELDAWPVMYERLIEYKEREERWPQAAEGKLGKLVQHPADCPEERDVVGRLYLAAASDRFRMGGTGQSLDAVL